MARRRSSTIEVSMFPFLSVLCSIIGVLMMFKLMIITERVVADQAKEQIVARSPVPVLETPREDAGISEDDFEELNEEINRLAQILGERLQEIQHLKDEIVKLEELIAMKEDETLDVAGGKGLLPGVQLEEPEKVNMKVDKNSTVRKQARFIEVKAGAFVIYHPDKEMKEFAAEQLEDNNSPLVTFFEEAHRQRRKKYLLFLVHPNGFSEFYQMRMFLIKKYPNAKSASRCDIDIGKEPFSRDWQMIAGKRGDGEE